MTHRDYQLVIVGYGLAAHRLLLNLAGQQTLPKSICVIGTEPQAAYNRILLTPLLCADALPEQLKLSLPESIKARLTEITDCTVVEIDRANCLIKDERDRTYGYETLVLATGAQAKRPNLPQINAIGVQVLRSWEDLERIQNSVAPGKTAVVWGGGVLGVEASDALRRLGMEVQLVHRAAQLMNRELDPQAAGFLRQNLIERGITVHTETEVSQINARFNRLQSVNLKSGEEIATNLLVVCLGIEPSTELAQRAGLEVNRGIRVNPQMQTEDPRIYALGECVEFENHTYGAIDPIWSQSDVLASTLAGEPAEYRHQHAGIKLKVSGIDLYTCGVLDTHSNELQVSVYLDTELRHYRKLCFQGNRLVGVLLFGDTERSVKLSEQIWSGAALDPTDLSHLFDL